MFLVLIVCSTLLILWSPLKNGAPMNFAISNFGHQVSKCWLRSRWKGLTNMSLIDKKSGAGLFIITDRILNIAVS